jgi:hypothetical protein
MKRWIISLIVLAIAIPAFATSLTVECSSPNGSVQVKHASSGALLLDCAGDKCWSGCVTFVTSGTPVALSAVPLFTPTFLKWFQASGSAITCNNSTSPNCSFTVTEDSSIDADFSSIFSTVTAIAEGPGRVNAFFSAGSRPITVYNAQESRQIDVGAELTFKAQPDSGVAFLGWFESTGPASVCNGRTTDCKVRVTLDFTIKGRFVTAGPSPTPVKLTVSVAGNGKGTVEGALPLRPPFMQCTANGSDCSENLNAGSLVTLKALRVPDVILNIWSDGSGSATVCNRSTQSECKFTISQNSTITATFCTTADCK